MTDETPASEISTAGAPLPRNHHRLNRDGSPGDEGSPDGEVVVWRDLYEQERQEREEADAYARELEHDLIAIANAGPIRALRLRRQLRMKLSESRSTA